MLRPFIAAAIVVFVFVWIPVEAGAGAKIYKWKDKSGRVHYTDNIEQVPEPWRSRYLKQEEQQAIEQKTSGPSQPVPTFTRHRPKPVLQPAAPTYTGPSQEETRKLYWRSQVRRWRRELAQAREEYDKLKVERDNLLRRYRETRVLMHRNRAEEIEKKMNEVKKKLDLAKKMLEEVLPEKARREGIPPGWLR